MDRGQAGLGQQLLGQQQQMLEGRQAALQGHCDKIKNLFTQIEQMATKEDTQGVGNGLHVGKGPHRGLAHRWRRPRGTSSGGTPSGAAPCTRINVSRAQR